MVVRGKDGEALFLFPCVPGDHIFIPLHYDPQSARHTTQEPSGIWVTLYPTHFIHSFMPEMFIKHLLCMGVGSGA